LLQVETSEERAYRFRAHAALQPKMIEDGGIHLSRDSLSSIL